MVEMAFLSVYDMTNFMYSFEIQNFFNGTSSCKKIYNSQNNKLHRVPQRINMNEIYDVTLLLHEQKPG